MPFKIVLILLLICEFMFLPVAAASSTNVNIITYGDSITSGVFRTSGGVVTCPEGTSREPGRQPRNMNNIGCYGNGVANKGGFQPLLLALLEDEGYSSLIFNYGYSGFTSDELLPFVPNVVAQKPSATHYYIMVGANDAAMGVSTSTLIANVSMMVSRVESLGLIPVISTVTRNFSSSAFDAKTIQYSQAIRDYASQNNVLLADNAASLGPNWTALNSGDGLHLNEMGNSMMADTIFAALGLNANDVNITPIISLLLD